MRTTSVNVVRIATKGPGDVSGLLSLIEKAKSIQSRSSRYWAKPKATAASTISRGNTPFPHSALPWRLMSISHRTAWSSGSRL